MKRLVDDMRDLIQATHAPPEPAIAVLTKPFSMDVMTDGIRSMIEARSRSEN